MTSEKFAKIMDQYPQYVLQYYKSNEEDIEKYIVENFWEEDVERWLVAIRNRSPKENLQVRKIDMLKKKNSLTHYTSDYDNKNLVLRRAAEFSITVQFGNRSFDPQRDDMSVVFSIGSDPKVATGSKFVCFAGDKAEPKDKWSCYITEIAKETKSVTLKIKIPSQAIVGRYSMSLEVTSGVKGGREKSAFVGPSVIVIFNPFSKDDAVYMENAAWRNEYVLNDEGLINVGSYKKFGTPSWRPWDFAQFDADILDSVLLMLQNDTRMKDKPVKALRKYSSPAYVSRVIAAMVNCSDDDGVLWGRWDGEYGDGKTPSSWTGSDVILREWKNKDMAPVKYGQCWVFSGIVTTALRAIGIPARSVTTFESAHDTERNQTIDIYLDEATYDKLEETSDSVWNFHVWNEGYFKRPDLPKGYDGWQVVDATPQEASDIADSTAIGKTLMQCGPAPVKAIKEGNINIGSDTGFVFSEVNADKVYWFVNKEGNITKDPIVQKNAVGTYIGTKAVGKMETENLIDQYKYPEGTPEERNAFNKAYSLGTQEIAFETDKSIVKSAFEITIDGPATPLIGEKFSVKVTVKNASPIKHEATLTVVGKSKLHTGRVKSVLKKETHAFELGAENVREFVYEVEFDDYIQNLADNYNINVVATVVSSTNGKVSIEEEDYSLDTPECFTIQLPDEVFSGQENSFGFTFTNKLPRPLTGGVFNLKARNCIAAEFREIAVGGPIKPGESRQYSGIKFHPKSNWRSIYCWMGFDCAQLRDITQTFRVKLI